MLKTSSIRINFIMNLIKVLLNLLFPLITFPYVTRILFAEGVGKVSFAQGVISYFILLSGLGLSIYGIRAVAKIRDDKEKLSKVVVELLCISTMSTIIVYFLFILFINIDSKAIDERSLYLIISISLILKNLGVEWFYQGIEQYKYITIRDILFKVISLIMLFLMVKEESDYIVYAFILTLSVSGSSILNFINLRKYINLKFTIKNINLRQHFKPLLLAFGFSISTSIYVNLDTVMLGYLSDDRAVGIYTASIRVTKIVVVLVTTLGHVLIPRLTYHIESKNYEQFRSLAKLSANFTLLLGLPAMIGLYILAPEVIYIFAGNDFMDAVAPMRILLPIIIFLGFSNFIGIQILYPYGKEKIVLISVLIGAAINIFFNFLLIPSHSYNGAAIATLLAEGIVLLIQLVMSRKLLNFLRFNVNIIKIITSSLIMGIALIILNKLDLIIYYRVILDIIGSLFIYLSCLIIFREELLIKLLKRRLIHE